MSATRRVQRSMRRAMGDKPSRRVDAMVRVHPAIDALLTERDLQRAAHNVPIDVARSRTKRREWANRIAQRLAVPEHVRMAFGKLPVSVVPHTEAPA